MGGRLGSTRPTQTRLVDLSDRPPHRPAALPTPAGTQSQTPATGEPAAPAAPAAAPQKSLEATGTYINYCAGNSCDPTGYADLIEFGESFVSATNPAGSASGEVSIWTDGTQNIIGTFTSGVTTPGGLLPGGEMGR